MERGWHVRATEEAEQKAKEERRSGGADNILSGFIVAGIGAP